jgi:hypothetical protein
MHPYRRRAGNATRHVWPDSEELILYALVAAIGAIPVVITLLRHADFGVEPTVGLLMIGVALGGFTRAPRPE